jgi:hypothetical protein
MRVETQVNTKGFEAACFALARVTGKSIEQVVKSEMSTLLEATMNNTRAATATGIRKRHEAKKFVALPANAYAPTTLTGLKSRANAKIDTHGNLLYFLGNNYPPALWNLIDRKRKLDLEKELHARGLAKKSWLYVARALGVPVSAPGFVQRAIPTTGREYPQNIAARKLIDQNKIVVSFRNAQPTVNTEQAGGRRALQTAINGRVKFFLQNTIKGVFNSMQEIAKKYPGLKLTKT